jgi:hypothetical protein
MNQDIESQLRRALRPVEPGADFTARVMGALPSPPRSAGVIALSPARAPARASRWQRFSMPTALAASLLVAIGIGRQVALDQEERRQIAGIEASRKLMQALRVTSQKLDLAYEAVQRPPPATPPAGENRS